jgi:putative glutamine amidotransferase
MQSVSTADSGLPPRIGLTSYRNRATWGVWNDWADLLPAAYAESVAVAGGAPVLLPSPNPTAARSLDDLANAVLDGLDGLVLTGGPDLDPALYGAEPHPDAQRPWVERDAWEIALTKLALDRGLPTLCICRGLQALNVALGGTLIQHLPDHVGHEQHSPTPGNYARHPIQTAPGSRTAAIYGEQAEVSTYHHQAIDRLAEGLTPTAWADDRTIEAVELDGPSWVTGVQWHPEVSNGAELFGAFVAAAAANRSARV